MVFVTSSPPPPPPPPSSQVQQAESPSCKYSVMVGGNRYSPIYQCFTEEEYAARNAQIAQDKAKADAERSNYISKELPEWWIANWWKVILSIFGIFIFLIILSIIIEAVDKKRNPWKYDSNGFKIYM